LLLFGTKTPRLENYSFNTFFDPDLSGLKFMSLRLINKKTIRKKFFRWLIRELMENHEDPNFAR